MGFLAILGKFPEKVNILEGPPARDEEIRAGASLWAWTGSGAFWQWLGGQLKLGTPGAKACPPIIWAANCKTPASHRMAPLWENPALKLCSRFCFHECWILQSVFVPSHLHETVLHRGLDLTSLDGDFDSLSCSLQDLTDDQALQIWHKGRCPENSLSTFCKQVF